MTEDQAKAVAAQLRQPEGEFGRIVGQKMNEGNLNMNNYTIKHLNLSENDSVLEIGMGNGYFVKDILNPHPTITYSGIDFSPIMVEEAIIMNQSFIKEGRSKFKMANVEQMPFDDNTFNKIFTINTIYFWEQPAKVLNECKRVLLNNGILLITIRPKYILDTFPISKYGFNTFGQEDVCELLMAHGFIIKDQIEIEEAEEDFFGERLKDTFVIVKAEKS